MSRWLVGTLDPDARTDSGRLTAALAPAAASVFAGGPLQVAFTGPPATAGQQLCLLDGWLDNAAELAAGLGQDASQGECSVSPEELLLAGYRCWGQGLLERLRGDFVLLIWDCERDEGLLARDQLGVRPLFMHASAGALHFASEVRQLLTLLPRRPAPDPASVAHWISISNRPGSDTLYSGIRRLGPGEALLLGRNDWRPRRYWKPRYRGASSLPGAELADGVGAELGRAVRRRSAGDNGLTGVLMSGGLDSSAIAAFCAQPEEPQTRAYSATFPEHPVADEAQLIGELGAALKLPVTVGEVRPGGLVAAALEHLTEWQMPLLGWGDFWTLPLLRAAAAAGVTTMLDGDGGDELFGTRSYLMADRLRRGHPVRALGLVRQLPGAGSHVPLREVARVAGSLAFGGAVSHRLQNAVRGFSARQQAPPWLSPQATRDLVDSDDPYAWKRLDGPRWWAHAAYGIAYGIEQVGVFEHQRRRAAMAGLEARHPMLDLDLVELALSQPPEASFDRRYSRPVLRAAMTGLLPDSVRLRPAKARFESLIVSCLTGPDAAVTRAVLANPRAELGAYLDLDRMRAELLDSEAFLRQAPFRWMWQVWRLLTAELWLRFQSGPLDRLDPKSLPSPAKVAIRPLAPSYLFPP
jgi:asparagine synthase (glutamine-hydrolysing)